MTHAGNIIRGTPERSCTSRLKMARYWLLLVGMLLTGCIGRVEPPAGVLEPATLYLIDHGRHSSLVLPRGDGVVRYAYGEWDWYAGDRRGVLAGMSAMLWPTRGTLGRRVYPGIPITPFPGRVAPEGVEQVFALQAETALMLDLQRNLDVIFEEGKEESVDHPLYDLEFVPHPGAYWFGHQSNQVTADWLRQLGFTVRGTVWFSDWRIEAPSMTDRRNPAGSAGR